MKFKLCINYADFIASQLKTCLYGISNCSLLLHMLYITWTIHFVLLNVGEIFTCQISFFKYDGFFVGYSNRSDGIEYFGAHKKIILIWSLSKQFQRYSFPLIFEMLMQRVKVSTLKIDCGTISFFHAYQKTQYHTCIK